LNPSVGILRRADDSGIPLLIARLLLGGIMISYAVPKILEPIDFLKEIHNYHIMPAKPTQLINLVAVVLPWIELLGSLALILGVLRRSASTLFTGLLVFFTVALLFRTLGIYSAEKIAFCDIIFDCGCGHGEVYICRKVAENVFLILLAAYGMVSRSTRLSLASLWNRPGGSKGFSLSVADAE